MDQDVNDLIRSIIARIRTKDFGLAFFTEVLSLSVWLLNWLKAGPEVFGDRADSLGLLIELNEELGGDVPFTGPISSILIGMVIKALVTKALEVLAESGLPAEVIDWIRLILESLQARV